MSKKKSFLKKFRYKHFMLISTIIIGFYYLLIAQNRYVSNSTFVIKSVNNEVSSAFTMIPGLAVSGGSKEDMLYLQSYIHSQQMYDYLQQNINLQSLYEKNKIDIFHKLFSFYTKEDKLQYYIDKTNVVYDEISGLLNIEVQAFTNKDAQNILKHILIKSEEFVNEISKNISLKEKEFALNQLNSSLLSLQKATNNLILFQDKNKILDPEKQAIMQSNLISELQKQISVTNTEIKTQSSYLNESSPKLKLLKTKLNSLNQELNNVNQKLVSNDKQNTLNNLSVEFNNIKLRLKFEQDKYSLALVNYEKLSQEAIKNQKHMVVIQKPTLAEQALYPQNIKEILTLLLLLSILYAITRLIKSIIEDHTY